METTNNTPEQAAPAAAPAPAPAPAVGGMAPVTKGNMPGGWNRFAGYNPNDAKNKKNDRRDRGDRKGRH